MDTLCFICQASLNEGRTVKVTDGLGTLRAVSLQREDGYETLLKDKTSITVHAECRRKYTNFSKGVLKYKNLTPKRPQPCADNFSPSKNKMRKNSETFDFVAHCFICTKLIKREFVNGKLRLSHKVNRPDFKDKFQNILLKINSVDAKFVNRRIQLVDLISEGAEYHQDCYMSYLRQYSHGPESGKLQGRPSDVKIDNMMKRVYNYIENNADCQFTMQELLETIGDDAPSQSTVQDRLQKKYGDNIKFISKSKAGTIVCFRDTEYTILKKSWDDENKNEEEERNKILKAAAAIIRDDIKLKKCDTTQYPPSDSFLADVDDIIPSSLQLFMYELIVRTKKGDVEPFRTKCTAINHAIMCAVRPRSFLSTLQVGLAVMLHRKFGSRRIIDILSRLGFCSSYSEATLYQDCMLLSDPVRLKKNIFAQYVFDNADFNINTIDGKNTFHSMGGIATFTPMQCFEDRDPVPRVKKRPSLKDLAGIQKIPFIIYEDSHTSGFKNIVVEPITIPDFNSKNIPNSEFLWISGKLTTNADMQPIPGWNGFMGMLTADLPFEKTRVLCLPFVNSSPSDRNTIYTVLKYAVSESKKINLSTCFVTFDQPLFQKAIEIVKSCEDPDVSKIIVRLGGFHLLMSFLGSIGYIMGGSGLTDVLITCYAKATVEKMLTGHAYSRAVRGHTLVYLALCKRILADVNFSEKEQEIIDALLSSCILGLSNSNTVHESAELTAVNDKFLEAINKFETRGKTAKLWIQYLKMVGIAKSFMRSEKTGAFEDQLGFIEQMLPYFHAAGHHHYAKSAHLYIQEMRNYVKKMENMCEDNSLISSPAHKAKQEYEKFVKNGLCTVRRTDKFWCGNHTDMTIEQDLMRVIKTEGGMVGRGITESTATKFILGMPFARDICEQVENFCRVRFSTTDQHVDARDSRIQRDTDDLAKIITWFDNHDPFPHENVLKCIATGVTAKDNINCHEAFSVGMKSLEKMIDKHFCDISLARKDRVQPLLAVTSKIKLDNDVVSVDPMLIFQRMCVTKETEDQLKEYLEYELAPYPLSLFHEGTFRKTQKSTLFDIFKPEENELEKDKCVYVIDGGMLLHRVVWHQNDSYNFILNKYVQYVKDHYGNDVTIVFDGYDENSTSTKAVERKLRANRSSCPDILFDESMAAVTTQEKFLSNLNNKKRFINLLSRYLKSEGNFLVSQAVDDADVLIVHTALRQSCKTPVIVAEDIDVLVLLTALTPVTRKIYFLKPRRGNIPATLYSSKSLDHYPFCRNNILFLHAVSGCDTTSCFYNKGKKGIFKTFEARSNIQGCSLKEAVEVFQKEDQSHSTISQKGMLCMLEIYKAPQNVKTVNEYRYLCFTRGVAKKKAVNLASLPPTADAAEQHFYRTYLQVQKWLSRDLPAEAWGWTAAENFTPVTMSKLPAPKKLLDMMFCKCKKACMKNCSCRKAGLLCSTVCAHCYSNECCNLPSSTVLTDDIDVEEEEIDDPDKDSDDYSNVENVETSDEE